MKTLIRHLTLALLPLALISAPAFAGDASHEFTNSIDAAVPALKGAPHIFLPKAHALNLAEIRAGVLGRSQACSASVRNYGRQLFNDHNLNDRQVISLVQFKRVAISPAPFDAWELANVRRQNIAINRLANIRSCNFDRQYLLSMVDAHNFAISVFTTALASSRDSQTRAYIQRTLPGLRMHLGMARSLLNRIR
jgi:putative membrane protein